MLDNSGSCCARGLGIVVCLAALVGAACQEKSARPVGASQPEGQVPVRDLPVEPTAAVDPVARALAERRLDHWYGIYLAGKKLGYARIETRPTRVGEPGGFLNRLELVVVAEGQEQRMTDARYYAGTAPYQLVELRATDASSDSLVSHRYLAGNHELTVQTTIDGRKQAPRTVPGTAETAMALVAQFPDPETVSVGHRATYAVFDLEGERDQVHTTTVIEVRIERLAGVETKIAALEERVAGEQTVTEARVARSGVVLFANLGGIEIKLEEQAVARSEVEGFDMIADATVIQRDLGDPSEIEELTAVVAVDPRFSPPDAPNQRVVRRADGRFDVVIRSIPGAIATAAERQAALAESPEVDWRAPAIAQQAAQIVAGAATDREKVTRLNAWVYTTLEKSLTSNLNTASQVLERRAGDCTEHALLLTALARSQGIAARQVGGVIYVGDELRGFGWHAWNEVILDGKWVQVDPTWGEPIANATHFKLGVEGHDDSIMAMGSLEISVSQVR